jgi:hypothetical protein
MLARKINTRVTKLTLCHPVIPKNFPISTKSIFPQKTNSRRKTIKIPSNKSFLTSQSVRFVRQKTKTIKMFPIVWPVKIHLEVMEVESTIRKTWQKLKVKSRNWFRETRETENLRSKLKCNGNKSLRSNKDKKICSWCKNTSRTLWARKRTFSMA